jgi:hypothetical protein
MIEIHYSEAESILGQRLDRRRKYAKTDNGKPFDGFIVFALATWTDSCSGCCETVEGYNKLGHAYSDKHHCLIGPGCHECGHHGVRRNQMWLPVLDEQEV